MTNGRNFKEIPESYIKVLKLRKRWLGEDGQIHQKVEWETLISPVSLGSMKKPNKEIIAFKINSQNTPKEPFGMFFRGFGG